MVDGGEISLYFGMEAKVLRVELEGNWSLLLVKWRKDGPTYPRLIPKWFIPMSDEDLFSPEIEDFLI